MQLLHRGEHAGIGCRLRAPLLVIETPAVRNQPQNAQDQRGSDRQRDRGSTVSIEVTYPVELIAYKLFVQQGSLTLGAKSQMTIMN